MTRLLKGSFGLVLAIGMGVAAGRIARAELPKAESIKAVPLFTVPSYCEGVVFDKEGRGYVSWGKSITRFTVDGSRRTTRYDIDLFKCIYCGFCEESCPVDSIVETHLLEYHFENRGESIVNKQQLLAIGDRLEAEIAERRAADAPFR